MHGVVLVLGRGMVVAAVMRRMPAACTANVRCTGAMDGIARSSAGAPLLAEGHVGTINAFSLASLTARLVAGALQRVSFQL